MSISHIALWAAGAALATFCLAGAARGEGVAKADVPKDAVILTAIIKARPGQEEAVKEALLAMVEPTRKEAGCLCYNLHQSKSDKAQFIFYEQWAGQAALDAHRKTAHMKAMQKALKGKTAEGGGVTFYELLK
jgi:quinol monooxygenase YgiN